MAIIIVILRGGGTVLSLCGKWLVCRKCMQFLFSKGKMGPNLANREAAAGGKTVSCERGQ